MDDLTPIGGGLVKRVCHLHGAVGDGSVGLRKKLSRAPFGRSMKCCLRCVVAIAACGGTHHRGRLIARFGQEVRLAPPIYAKRCVKRLQVRRSGLLQ